jgi:hypothetical protein
MSKFLHWILGIPAVLFILVFVYVPLSQFYDKAINQNWAIWQERRQAALQMREVPWIFSSEQSFLYITLAIGLMNLAIGCFAIFFLLKRKSFNLLFTFMVFFSLYFFVMFLSGNWMI